MKKLQFFLIISILLVSCQPAPSPVRPAHGLIAFNSTRNGHSEVYAMNLDGSGQKRLTALKTGENLFSAWSPDGTRIAFVSKQDDEALLYVVKADGSYQINLTNAYLTGNFETIPPDRLPSAASASAFAPADVAEKIRSALFDAQLLVKDDSVSASQKLAEAESAYSGAFSSGIKTTAPAADVRIRDGFAAAGRAISQKDISAFAVARSQIWTSILLGSYSAVEDALKRGDGLAAQQWLAAREFPLLTTRFSHSDTSATLAVSSFANGQTSADDALLAVRTDLLGTYQSRLQQSLADLLKADANDFQARRAELAALAEGYFLILTPAYLQQRGTENADLAVAAFAGLRANALADKDLSASMQQARESLRGFRALPLSPIEQSRRSGQLTRFLSLVQLEYKRGVSNGQVIRAFEVQEAIAFHAGAYAAFADLEYLLDARDPEKAAEAEKLLNDLGTDLAEAGKQAVVASPDEISARVDALMMLLTELMPVEWSKETVQAERYEIFDTDPVWSPDGKRILFSSNAGVNLEVDGSLNLYVVNVNGSGLTKLTDAFKYNGMPAWSPDGKKIAFVADRKNNLDIYVMNADGSGQTNLTEDSPAHDLSATWSPDGQKILFVSERDGNSEIYVIHADGSGLVNLTKSPSAFDVSPAWSPDGKKIVFASTESGQSDIFVMNADGSGPTNLTKTPKAYDISPRWSPDGSQIVFASNRDGNLEIYVMHADGSGQTNLTNNPAEDSDPVWRP